MSKVFIGSCIALLALASYTSVFGAGNAGKTTFVRGTATSQSADGDITILARGEPLFEGHTVRTGNKSLAVLELNDATRVVLRPQSIFRIEEYSEEAGGESALVRLFKGGLRSISGAISKRKRNAFKVATAVATIGIRGTEYDVRLCAGDCKDEAQKLDWASSLERRLIRGRVALMRGQITVRNENGIERQLGRRGPLFEGDTITSSAGSFAVLIFSDRSRVTLRQSSSFKIEEMRYNVKNPDENSSIFRLITGGLRQVTGLIGRNQRNRVKVRTAVATIGIRGTGFDLYCGEGCSDVQTPAQSSIQGLFFERATSWFVRNAHAASTKGLIVNVWQGGIDMSSTCGTESVEEGSAIRFELEGCKIEQLASSPIDDDSPRPDEPEIDFEELFDASDADGEPGLYLACFEGSCTLTNDQGMVELSGGEAAYAADENDTPRKLDFIPTFQSQDPWLEAIDGDKRDRFNLLDDDIGGESFQCSIF